jgi:AcrR family transcriptional regulator
MATTTRGRRASSQRKGDANEQAILDTAERLLGEVPLSDVSVQALARGAGISRSSFYFYFGSKEHVLLALVDRLAEALAASVEAALARVGDDPRGGLTDGIEATAQLWRDHGPVLRAAVEAASVDAEVQAVWDATLQRFIDGNARLIAAERERGAAPAGGPSPRELASALVLLNERAFYMSSLGSASGLADEQIVGVLTEIWLRAIYGA